MYKIRLIKLNMHMTPLFQKLLSKINIFLFFP